MRDIYLDNAATTRCCSEAVEAMERVLREDYGNPSSMHRKGFEAEKIWKGAMKTLADTLAVTPEEIVFTSGGTESDNMAILGIARTLARRGKHIITSAVEHAAVANTAASLERDGYEITVLPVDGLGLVDPEEVKRAMREDTILVSVMAVNNETGSVQRLEEIGKAVKSEGASACFHTDAVQGYGKIDIDVKKCGIDLLSVSGHKLHGPKGTGFLYVKKGIRLEPIMYGGGQQGGLRSGTMNVPGAAGLAAAAARAFSGPKDKGSHDVTESAAGNERSYIRGLRDLLADDLKAGVENIVINGPAGTAGMEAYAAPHILSVSVPGVRAEVLLHALEDEGIYVSAGSACSSHQMKKTRGTATLRAMGLDEKLLDSTVRFSLSGENTAEEMEETAAVMSAIVPKLRRFS
ncbi:MAG: cysteine desulfurase [Oscillospiraceae bacterium]|nr:cysteine desulfurase [Oscillospiraceae bacterium]